MTIIHANDPTTNFLSLLYEGREDLSQVVDEHCTNGEVFRAIRSDDTIMMLGHGNPFGLFSCPDKNGRFNRFLITDRHVEFLRGKTCIGIWCYAKQFAERYGLKGLFSDMIVSELQEAVDLNIPTTQAEIDNENLKFVTRLRHCIDTYDLKEIPQRLLDLDDVHSELTRFNYGNMFYFV